MIIIKKKEKHFFCFILSKYIEVKIFFVIREPTAKMLVFYLTFFLFIGFRVNAFDVMRYAEVQYTKLYQEFLDSSKTFYPAYGYPLTTDWERAVGPSYGWTQGFFPGVLWNLVEYNASQTSLKRAMDVTGPTAYFANVTNTQDVGFVIMPGFGNGYRLFKRSDYRDIIITGAHSLATRYSPIVRCTRSWDTPSGFLVVMDNMMNLEILFVAANLTNNQTLYNMGWQHANRTMYEHFRENNGSYHVVIYNETDGSVIEKRTAQGYANWSTWARGQSWSIYGFTQAYRFTGHRPFLDKAIGATNYVLGRLSNDTDLIPYWDYDAPYNSTIPYQPRDTSAGAILASALLELQEYVPTSELKNRYLTTAKTIIEQLSSSKYMIYGNPDYKLSALLTNGTWGPYPKNPFDVSLSYGDYYLTQAIVRLSKL